MKKLLFLMLAVVAVGAVCSCGNKQPQVDEQAIKDSIAKALRDSVARADSIARAEALAAEQKVIQEKTAFLEQFLKKFDNNTLYDQSGKKLQKYLTGEALAKLRVMSVYEDASYYYDVEYFRDGRVTGDQHGDYYGVKSRTVTQDDGDWYKIYTVSINNMPRPTTFFVKVERTADKYMITDLRINK